MLETPYFFAGIFFISMLVFSLTINFILVKFSRNIGIRNSQEPIIRWNSKKKPAIGGISFFIIYLLSVVVGLIFFDIENSLITKYSGILATTTIGFLMGLFDDAFNTKPLLKFFTQLLCGIILIITGTSIHFFEIEWLNYFLTVFWIVSLMNSINMLDNMDGIATIVSLFILLAALFLFFTNISFPGSLLVLILGSIAALAGFLYFNWPESKMFMGDTGSQFLGVFLGIIGISFFWNFEPHHTEITRFHRAMAVLLVFYLPIIDTTTVTIKRLSMGRSPFVGGKDHTTHHLAYTGLSEKRVALLFVILSFLGAALSVAVFQFSHIFQGIGLLPFLLFFIITFVILFYIANKNKDKSKQ